MLHAEKSIRRRVKDILAANLKDLAGAEGKKLNQALLDRLSLSESHISSLADSLVQMASLPDPVGLTLQQTKRADGLLITRTSVPIGVIALIYESRPNVTIDAGALAIKAGNAIVLRGGSEAFYSNQILTELMREALDSQGLNPDCMCLVPFTDRQAIGALLGQTDCIDLAIPRGGESLIRFAVEHSKVPMVQHYSGVCHMYMDEPPQLPKAYELVYNAKISRPGVCNALECLLVHEKLVNDELPGWLHRLRDAGCEIRGCERTKLAVPWVVPAQPSDYGAEFLAKILLVKVVAHMDEALVHIQKYGSGHTEAIVSSHQDHIARFRKEVDAACVVSNASTRFHDGGEFGLGAELGIATSRLHWRGPMGLESLTTMKWLVEGEGHVRA